MRTLLLFVMAVFCLTGCSDPDATPAIETPARPMPAKVLGGVDLSQPLRAIGTEPFWSVEITTQELAYSAPDSPGLRIANPGPTVQGTTAVYAAAGGDEVETLVVTLIATECSDGMSDRTYPLTARVELGQSTLLGCAAPVSALNASPAP